MNRTVACLLITFALAAKADETTAPDNLPAPSPRKGLTYEKDIKPIFETSCVKCHGPERAKAKLRLDSLAGVKKGSEDGEVIEPGNSAKSLLVKSVAHVGDEDLWMPPPKNKINAKKLSDEQIGVIRAWIDQGAK